MSLSNFKLWSTRPTAGGMALIRALGGKRIRTNRRKPYRVRRKEVLINWGSTEGNFNGVMGEVLNHPVSIQPVVDKLQFFIHIDEQEEGKNCVPFTTDKDEALKWIKEGAMVVARTVLNGHSGAGIVIAGSKNELPDAPLYTKYIKKDEEYRVHFILYDNPPDHEDDDTQVDTFYVQKKVKRKDYAGKHNRLVRNHDNGYTYQHNNVEVPAAALKAVKKVALASGLDFGAVDVIYCKKDNKVYVLEINTAPGLEGESLKRYSDTFQKYYGK